MRHHDKGSFPTNFERTGSTYSLLLYEQRFTSCAVAEVLTGF